MTVDSTHIVRFFSAYPEVVAVYLFGSHAKGHARTASDLDLAVLYRRGSVPDTRAQWALRQRLEALTGTDVDLVVMNTANPILKHQIYRHGRCLLNRHPRLTTGFAVRALMEYDDLKRVRRPIEQAILKGRRYG